MYKEFEVMPHTGNFYDPLLDDDFPLDFTEICEATQTENMKPITPDLIEQHPLGMVTLHRQYLPGCVLHARIASYAGITGFEQRGYATMAVVGSIITLPQYSRAGHGLATVTALEAAASTTKAVAAFGHDGLLARCNEFSKPLLEKLAFKPIRQELGKFVMVKYF